MTEENNQEILQDEAVDSSKSDDSVAVASTPVSVEESEEMISPISLMDEEPDRSPKKRDESVELPESVKLKLEKRKEARLKQQKKKKGKKRKERKVNIGKAFVKSTYNNTIVTLTDLNGNVISWASAGIAGFKGPKKATPYASQIITKIACNRAKEEYGLKEVSVFVRGVGTGRESAVRALNANGLIITSIKDITPVPHNGCRAKKPRRV